MQDRPKYFEKLVVDAYPHALTMVSKHVDNKEDAPDIVHKGVISALRSWHTYNHLGSTDLTLFKKWFLSIVYRKMLDHIRDTKHCLRNALSLETCVFAGDSQGLDELDYKDTISDDTNFEQEVLSKYNTLEMLRTIKKELPRIYWDALKYDLDDYTNEEVKRLTNSSNVNTVKTRIKRGKERAQKILIEHGYV